MNGYVEGKRETRAQQTSRVEGMFRRWHVEKYGTDVRSLDELQRRERRGEFDRHRLHKSRVPSFKLRTDVNVRTGLCSVWAKFFSGLCRVSEGSYSSSIEIDDRVMTFSHINIQRSNRVRNGDYVAVFEKVGGDWTIWVLEERDAFSPTCEAGQIGNVDGVDAWLKRVAVFVTKQSLMEKWADETQISYNGVGRFSIH